MPTFGNTFVTLADLRKQTNARDEAASIIEVMRPALAMLDDAPAFECNEGHTHLTTMRAGLPVPTWPMLNQGVIPSKGLTTQVRDATGYAEAWAEADERIVMRAKNPQRVRWNAAQEHLQGLALEVGRTILYGNVNTEPTRFTGFAPRYNSLTADNGNQIIDAGGTGADNTSIWFIRWGENTAHLIYPEGTTLGIQRKDLGEETKQNTGDQSVYRVFRERFSMHVGLALRDWRAVSRVANISVPALSSNASTGADLLDRMIDAYYALDNAGMASGNTVIYCSRTIARFLHKQAVNKMNVLLTLDQVEGQPVTSFIGIPIKRMDTLLDTEARVV